MQGLTFSARAFVLLCLFAGFISGKLSANDEGTYYENSKVIWRGDAHQPHYADINGDGVSDLFLQGRSRFHFSYWVAGERTQRGAIAYHNYNSRFIYAPLHHTSLTLGDVNGDGLSDVITPHGIMFASDFGLEPLDNNALSLADGSYLPENDYIFKSGDFNGDSMDDVLALSKNGDEHLVFHALVTEVQNEDTPTQEQSEGEGEEETEPEIIKIYSLTFAQQIKGNRWGQKRQVNSNSNSHNAHNPYQEPLAERISIVDVDGDGKHDIFARAVKANIDHYVAYANEAGLFTNDNSKKLKAKLTGVDWHVAGYSAVVLPQPLLTPSLTGTTEPATLMRMNNAEGGINERGEITPIYIDPVNHLINLHSEEVLVGQNSQLRSKIDNRKTESVLKSSGPPTPTTYPDVVGGSYQPYGQTHTVTFNAVSGAAHYELYQSFGDTNNYQKIYEGSSLSYSGAIGHTWGYYYYAYKACNYLANECSGLSPARRIYVYTNPSLTGSISFSPNGVNTFEDYNVNFGPAGGAVDGTTYTLTENGAVVWSHTRQSWNESVSYQLSNVSKQCPGEQVYSFQACNPGDLCSNTLSATQTIYGTGTETTPNITSSPITTATAGTSYSYQLNVSRQGCNSSTATTYSLLTAPSGMSVSSNGLITWLPATQGQYTVNVRASIGSAHTYQQYTINVTLNSAFPNVVWADVKSLNQQDFIIKWGLANDAQPNANQIFKLEQQYNNGSWTHIANITGSTQANFTNQSAGRYRYRVSSCGTGSSCSQAVQTVPFTVGSLADSMAIDFDVGLTDKKTNVGFTAGAFKVNESGAATYTVPITLPSGVAGVKPQVALQYNSQGGIGIMGRGWQLSAAQGISRCSPTLHHHNQIDALSYTNNDKFCYNGQFLDIHSGSYGASGSKYHTHIDQQVEITAHGQASSSGPEYFTLINKSGDTWYFGNTTDSFVEPGNVTQGAVAKVWMVNKITDVAGNNIEFIYDENQVSGYHALSEINYGGNVNASTSHFAKVKFNYKDSLHPLAGFSDGAPIDGSKLLENIVVTINSQAYRLYKLDYTESHVPEVSNYLDSITECIDTNNCLEPVTFEWSRPSIPTGTVTNANYCEANLQDACTSYTTVSGADFVPFDAKISLNGDSTGWYASQILDVSGDGIGDIIFRQADAQGELGGWQVRLGPYMTESETYTITGHAYDNGRPIDIDGDGVYEYLFWNDDDTHSWRVSGWADNEPAPLKYLYQSPKPAEHVYIGDVNGDGLQDVVFIEFSQVYFYPNLGTSYPSLGAPQALADLSGLSNHNDIEYQFEGNSLTDINGDGRSDALLKLSEIEAHCDGYPQVTDPETCHSAPYNSVWFDLTRHFYYTLIVEGNHNANLYDIQPLDMQPLNGRAAQVADLNGDGLSDLFYKGSTYWQYHLSTGDGFLPARSTDMSVIANSERPLFIDLNQDGRADILYPSSDFQQPIWDIRISRAVPNSEQIIWEERGTLARAENEAVLLGDINGDGRPDLLTAGNDNGWFASYGHHRGEILNVITGFTTGKAGSTVTTEIDYGRLNQETMLAKDQNGNVISFNSLEAHSFEPTWPMALVKQVRNDIALVDPNDSSSRKRQVSVNYRYGGYQLHRQGLNSLGFSALQTKDNQSGVVTTTYYHQDYPYIGMPKRTEQYSAATAGKTLSESENTYITQTAHHGGVMIVPDISTQTAYHLGNDSNNEHIKTTITTSESTYDGWGNITEQTVKVKNANGSLLHTTVSTNSYGTSASEKFYGRLSQSQVSKTLGGQSNSTISRSSSFTYYAQGESCQITGSSASAQIGGMLKSSTVNGKVTSQCYNQFGQSVSNQVSATLNLNDTQSTELITHKRYSSNGRVMTYSTDVAGHNTYYYYNKLSHGNIPDIITSIRTRTPNKVFLTSYFNDWGEEIAQQSTLASTSYSVKHYCSNNPSSTCPAGAVFAIEGQQAGSPSASQYFDAWGREVGTRTDHFENGKNSYTRKAYDNQGRLEYSYQATTSSAPSSYYQKLTHDNVGRILTTTLPNGGVQQQIHTSDIDANGNTVLLNQTTDPLGNITKQYRNLLGQLVKVVDATGGELHYTYNAFGDLLTVTQIANGTSTLRMSHQYNTYGQKTHTYDSQIGTWSYQYNGFGEVIQQTDANNNATTKVYDSLGRLAQQYSYDSNQCWTFSNTIPTIGKVTKVAFSDTLPSDKSCASSADVIHSIDNFFDNLGRPIGQKETISNQTSVLNDSYYKYQNYDQHGRLKYSKSAGTGTVIRQDYNTHGRTYRWVNDRTGRVYQKFNSANEQGQISLIQYANGTKEYLSYASASGQITGQTLTGTYASHYAGYQYNIALQLSSQERNYGATSQYARTSESFDYDNLYRLTQKSVSVAIAGTLPSELQMVQTFNYNGFGQIQSQTGIGNYQYNSKDQLTSISGYTKSNQAQFTGATYDNNGNLLGDGVRDFQYTSYNKAHTITKGSNHVEFIYGLNHSRFARTQTVNGETTNTAYIAGGVEKVVKGGHIQYRTTVQNIVLTDSNGDSEHSEAYLHKDRQGSPITITNESGRVVQQFGYGPFGKVYQLQTDTSLLLGGIAPTNRHYTGHESVSDFNLIHMNGRMYDPSIGRFIQADPFVQQVDNTQNYNRYSYVLNNPMNYTDPSGYLIKDMLRAFADIPVVNTFIIIGLNFIPGCQTGWCTAVYVGATTYATTGSLGQGVRSGLISYITAQAHGVVGDRFEAGTPGNIFGNAMVGGTSAHLQGGKFGHAFAAAGFAAAFKPLINEIGGVNSGNAAVREGNLAKLEIHKVDRIIAAGIIGGTASVISGGKFANGAISGALAQMYNGEETNRKNILNATQKQQEQEARTVAVKLLTVRQGIDHSAIWISDDGEGSGQLIYDPAGGQYFPEGEEALKMRRMDIFSGKYASVEDYIATFDGDVDVIDFMVTPEEARLITAEFKIGTPFFCAADCAFALGQSPRLHNLEGFFPGTVHNSLKKLLEESN